MGDADVPFPFDASRDELLTGYRAQRVELDRLRAENERLRGEAAKVVHAGRALEALANADDAEADRDRLRIALRELVEELRTDPLLTTQAGMEALDRARKLVEVDDAS